MKTSPWSPVWRWTCGGLLLAAGLLSNLGSNVASGGPGGSYGQCQAGSATLTALPPGVAGWVGTAGAPLGDPVLVRLTCRDTYDGKTLPAARVTLQWVVQNEPGLVNGTAFAETVTDDNGLSQVLWTLGSALGSQTLRVNAGTATTLVQATALAAVAGDSCLPGAPGGTQFSSVRVVPVAETWTLAGSPYRGTDVVVADGALLRIDPGVKVCINSVSVQNKGRLVAEGTAEAPVRWGVVDPSQQTRSLVFPTTFGTNAQPSVLRHVQADNLDIWGTGHPLVVEDSSFTVDPRARAAKGCLAVRSSADAQQPSHWRRVVFNGYGGSASRCGAAVQLEPPASGVLTGPSTFEAQVLNSLGDGVSVASGNAGPAWRLQACTITANGSQGVVFQGSAQAAGGTVNGCSLVGNAGLGVNNLQAAAYTVNAQGNWWGDAAGPLASGGDGVSTGVDTSGHLSADPNAAPR